MNALQKKTTINFLEEWQDKLVSNYQNLDSFRNLK